MEDFYGFYGKKTPLLFALLLIVDRPRNLDFFIYKKAWKENIKINYFIY